MAKISQIEISDFRGFKGLRTLDLGEADIVIFLGMNGFGKSSIFDAVEWGLTGHLSRYEPYLKTGRKLDFQQEKKVLRNKYAPNPNTFVKINLDNGKKFGRRVSVDESNSSDYNTGSIIESYSYGIDSITKQSIDIDHANHYLSATHVLSQDTINHFITSKKPDERYEALAVNFGTSLYKPFEENIQSLLAKVSEKEKVLKEELEDQKKFLKEYKEQISLEDKSIKEATVSANKILTEIKKTTNRLKISKFEFENGEIVTIGGSSSDIKKLKNLVEEEINSEQRKIDILDTLVADYKNWKEYNSQIKKIDTEVGGLKARLVEIDSINREIHKLNGLLSSSKAELNTELSALNVAENVQKRIPEFLAQNLKIETNQQKLKANKVSLTEKQKDQLNLREKQLEQKNLSLDIEQKIEKISGFIPELKTKQKENLSDSLLALNKKREELQKAISRENKTIEKYRSLEFTIDLGLKDFLKEIGLDNYQSFHQENLNHVKDATKTLKELDKLEELIKIQQTKLKELERIQKQKEEDLTRSKAMLAQALQEISQRSESKIYCPVCDTSHENHKLIQIVESKLESSEFDKIKKSRDEIRAIKKSLESCMENKERLAKDLHGIQSQFVTRIRKILDKHFVDKTKISRESEETISKIMNLEIEFDELLRRSFAVSGVKSKNIEDALVVTQKKLDELLQKKKSIDENALTISKAQDQLIKEIDILSAENQKAGEDIKASQAGLYQDINLFLAQHKINIKEDISLQVAKFISELKQKVAHINASADKNSSLLAHAKSSLEKLIAEGNREQVEKRINIISQETSLINRFISNYREKCMNVDVPLDKLTRTTLEKELRDRKIIMTGKKKITYSLSRLSEESEKFEKYLKEKRARKKSEQTQRKISEADIQLKKIKNLKTQINESKKQFPKVLETYIKQNLDVKLFNKIYESLNPHRRFKIVDFDIDVKRDKVGINFNASHSGIQGRPEFLFSSAQLNTFGVSMFLSMALRQNWLDLDTVLLDDPIQNLDDINVLSLIDLLRSLLDIDTGKQIIISTHDERFYNLIRRKFSDYRIKSYKFKSYGQVYIDPLEA